MSAFGADRCPWTTLGVERTASPKEVREAYRKMAFKWHPDLNQEVADAHQRFQAVTAAFEEIKRRHARGDDHRTKAGSRGTTNSAPRYHYQASSFRRDADQSFSNFRRGTNMNSNFSAAYEDDAYARGSGRRVTRESVHAVRSRMRAFETFGVGIGFFIVAFAASMAMVGTEVLWYSVNRGKSFEDVVKEMQSRPKPPKYPEGRNRKPPPEGSSMR